MRLLGRAGRVRPTWTWRRGRDSTPREASTAPARLAGGRTRPLCDPPKPRNTARSIAIAAAQLSACDHDLDDHLVGAHSPSRVCLTIIWPNLMSTPVPIARLPVLTHALHRLC